MLDAFMYQIGKESVATTCNNSNSIRQKPQTRQMAKASLRPRQRLRPNSTGAELTTKSGEMVQLGEEGSCRSEAELRLTVSSGHETTMTGTNPGLLAPFGPEISCADHRLCHSRCLDESSSGCSGSDHNCCYKCHHNHHKHHCCCRANHQVGALSSTRNSTLIDHRRIFRTTKKKRHSTTKMFSPSNEVDCNPIGRHHLSIIKLKICHFLHDKVKKLLLSPSNVLILFPILLLILLDSPTSISCDSQAGKHRPSNRLSRLAVMEQGTDLEIKQQKFRKKPEELISLYEGETIVLDCEVDDQASPAFQWKKDDDYIFWNRTRVSWAPDRYKLLGDGSLGVQSLKLTDAQLEDSGRYECQINSDRQERVKFLRAATNVSVLARPIADSQQQQQSQQQQHQQPPPTAHQLASEFATPHLTKESQLQARDILSLPKLSQGPSLQLSSATFITPDASAAHHPLARNSDAKFTTNLMISWPYILLSLAGVLLVANIFLIYSLVKRHQRVKATALYNNSNNNNIVQSGGC